MFWLCQWNPRTCPVSWLSDRSSQRGPVAPNTGHRFAQTSTPCQQWTDRLHRWHLGPGGAHLRVCSQMFPGLPGGMAAHQSLHLEEYQHRRAPRNVFGESTRELSYLWTPPTGYPSGRWRWATGGCLLQAMVETLFTMGDNVGCARVPNACPTQMECDICLGPSFRRPTTHATDVCPRNQGAKWVGRIVEES